MNQVRSLNLLVIDEDQLLAEKIIAILKNKNISCKFQILDEKEELQKALRRNWDVALFGKTYDVNVEDFVASIRALEKDIPIVAMVETADQVISTEDASDKNIVNMLDIGISSVYLRTNIHQVAIAIYNQSQHLTVRRKIRSLQDTLAETEMRATLLLKNSRSAVSYISEGVHIFVNEAYQQLFGYETLEEVIGVPVIDLIAGKNVSEFKEFLTAFMKGDRSNLEFVFESVRTDGSTFEAKLQLASASHEGEACAQIIIHQHNQANEAVQAQLEAAERTDTLTGLGNRRAFDEELKQARSQAVAKHESHALVYINIDNMSDISTTIGIDGTDATVLHVSKCLTARYPNASVNRFNDSGFTIIDYNIDKDVLIEKTEALREAIAKDLIDVDGKTATTTISAGMVMITDASPNTDELFDRAYSAINKVKKSTKGLGNSIHMYDPYANASSSKTALVETVSQALENNMFKLQFQPIYQLADDSSNFYETYVRLPLEDGTEIPPDEFLEIAEQCNILERLDRWIMLTATKMLRQELQNDPDAHLLINLSANAISDDSLPDFAIKLNQALGVTNKKKLTLQFNEYDVSNLLGNAKIQFQKFQQAGCNISISHFGFSPKSLDIFTHLKPNLVKLDRSHAENLGDNETLSTTLNFISNVNERGVETIVAFIEDAATMSAAWKVGAQHLQGAYLQPPSDTLGVEETE